VSQRRAPRDSRASRVWVLTAALLTVTLLMWSAMRGVQPLVSAGQSVPWWLLTVTFGITEVFVMHLRIARHAHSFSLSEIPLVFGIAFVSPGALVLAEVVGIALALAIHRRQKPIRLAFNVAQRASTTLLAVATALALDPILPHGWPAVWLSLLGAALIADIAGGMLINVAISLTEGTLKLFDQLVGVGTALTIANTALALVAIMIVRQHPVGLILVAAPAATTYLAGRAFTDLQRKHEDVTQLQRVTAVAQRSLEREDMIPLLLQQIRETFNADIAELLLWPEDAQPHIRCQVGPANERTGLDEVSLDPTVGVWARVASERDAVLLPRPIRNDALRRFFGDRQIDDAIVAPVSSDDQLLGILTVANRVGEFSTFDHDDVELLRTLANHVAVTIRNSLLLQRLEGALAHETEMSRLKDEFVATVSHELRTPITNVQGFVKTLLRPDVRLTPAERDEFLRTVDRHAERLKRLIEDLLFASHVESSEQIPTATDVIGLPALIERVVQDEARDSQRERIDVAIAEVLPSVLSNEEDAYRILRNLVDNALKYSPAEERVTISAATDGGGVIVRVHDRGTGVDPQERERIFDRFYQVDQSATRRAGGIGMGLYICRRAAERLGARIWLERSDATGSVFAVWLPVGSDAMSIGRNRVDLSATA
jgi:signal transduction histidine kinase